MASNIQNLGEREILLIHGTADENVHVQHSMLLAQALTEKSILHRQQFYPNAFHDLEEVKGHLYDTMSTFFEECFAEPVKA